jgi:hypothetical protein
MHRSVSEHKADHEGHEAKSEPLSGMPTITCECGAEIMVVPDVKGMSAAIKNHLARHKKEDANRIEDSLIEKAIKAISDTSS